jgi:hypothetical protein
MQTNRILRVLCRTIPGTARPQSGFHAVTAAVSKTCLVSFDRNRYSVSSLAVGRPVEVQAYADRIVIRQDGAAVGEHARCFGRDQIIYDPWYYVPVLARKPGALRNGAPFKNWVLPASLENVRRKLRGSDDGGRDQAHAPAKACRSKPSTPPKPPKSGSPRQAS